MPRASIAREGDLLLSIEQAAVMLGITKKVLYQWRWKQKGPKYVMVGRFVKYWKGDVLDWLKANEIDPEAA